MSSSLAGRPRPTEPICARRRRTGRPERLPRSRIFWRATSFGAPRSTPSRRRSTVATRSTCARPTRPCAQSTAFAFSITKSITNRPRRASVSTSPKRSRERRIFRPTSRFPGRLTPRSRTRTSRFASRASNTVSATQSCSAKACPRRWESLLKSADYEIYVRDRSPQAHFAGRAYVLPRQGQQGAPLVTVNTAKVSIDVYRIGDRNLLRPSTATIFSSPSIPRAPRRSPPRTAPRSGAGRWTSPPRSTRTSSPIFPCSTRSAS